MIFSKNGVNLDKEQVKSIIELEDPILKELLTILGMFNT